MLCLLQLYTVQVEPVHMLCSRNLLALANCLLLSLVQKWVHRHLQTKVSSGCEYFAKFLALQWNAHVNVLFCVCSFFICAALQGQG
jgi:hypothetical protein